MSNLTNAPSQADLVELIGQLTERISTLEGQVTALKASQPDVPDDHLVAIAAAVSAFLGHKARIRAVQLSSSRAWVSEGRGRTHNRAVPHSR